MRKGGKKGLSILSFGENKLSPSPWHCPGLLSRRQTLGTFQAEKLKPITHTARPRMKSRKLGIWQEGKRSKTGNWLGQACGKSRQPNKPLMEVPRRQPLPPPPPSALSRWEDLGGGAVPAAPREAQSEHVSRWSCGGGAGGTLEAASLGSREGGSPSQWPWALSIQGNATPRNGYCSPKAAPGETQIRWLHSLKTIEAASFLVPCYWNPLRGKHIKMLIRNDLKIMELKSVKKGYGSGLTSLDRSQS